MAIELAQAHVDVLVTDSAAALSAAKQATAVIPIVAVLVADPVAAGFVKNYAHPGGNITGFTLLAPELGTKRLEVLKETVPAAHRIGVLWNSVNVSSADQQLEVLGQAARRLGLEIVTRTVQHRDELASAFDSFKAEQISAVMTLADAMLFAERQLVVDLALAAKMPGIFPERPFVDAGGLLSYGLDVIDVFARAAGYVVRILKGEKPGDLPILQPAKFDFVINLKSAKAIGLTVPPMLLAQAGEVIE